MNKLFKTFQKHFGREDAITIVNGVNSSSNKGGGDDDDNVKIVNIEYSNYYSAIVTLNKQVTRNDVINHLKVFVFDNDNKRRFILEHGDVYDDRVEIGDTLSDREYVITINDKQLNISNTVGDQGPTLSTICWL